MYTKEIFDLVSAELNRQSIKWGSNRVLDKKLWITILGEEYGEVCKACLERNDQEYIEELIDVAASAISAINSFMIEKSGDQNICIR